MRLLALAGLTLLVVFAGCVAPASAPGSADSAGPAGHAPPAPQVDVLGWEDGHWHNGTLDVDNSDGLTAQEREAVVARAKARVEYVRGLEFNGSVGISVVSRSNFSAGNGGNASDALRRFDNAKFEALFLVGEGDDSISAQSDSLNASVAGYYSPSRNDIVVVSDAETPSLDGERTLAHELVHALQDQQFDLNGLPSAQTRDEHNGRNGLIEGDAALVEERYLERCGEEWTCIDAPDDDGDEAVDDGNRSGPHLGIYLLQFFPYSDGPGFVTSIRDGDWNGVNDAYQVPPDTAAEVIDPTRYPDVAPDAVDLADDLRDGWTRVRPPDRPDYATVGQSGLTAMFGYTIYDDYNRSSVVAADELLNLTPTGVNGTDPINYDVPPVRGWSGDRLHAYHRDGATAYRWRVTWHSRAASERFADAYRSLLDHWGGQSMGDGRWRVSEGSPFAGAYRVDITGETVTIAHADSETALSAISPSPE